MFWPRLRISSDRPFRALHIVLTEGQHDTDTVNHHELGSLVSWCFEPSQPPRITSGLNTNSTLSPSYSFLKSSYHKSCLFVFC